jgi:hypothetical protein
MNNFTFFILVSLPVIWLIVIVSEFFPEYTSSYRQGQIDALNGKINVELKQQPDGSTKCERK